MSRFSRRHFMGALVASVPALAAPQRLLARAAAPPAGPRALDFHHLHTGERLDVEYFDGARYLPDALTTVNHFLRDFRTGDIHPIDPALLDLLHGLTDRTRTGRPFDVISGYRSPVTNEMLRHHSEGVARNSLHMQGKAIDIRLADVPLPRLRTAALDLHRGGVGFYPASDFVHVDTGRVRTW